MQLVNATGKIHKKSIWTSRIHMYEYLEHVAGTRTLDNNQGRGGATWLGTGIHTITM
jgi:hypothetical protein